MEYDQKEYVFRLYCHDLIGSRTKFLKYRFSLERGDKLIESRESKKFLSKKQRSMSKISCINIREVTSTCTDNRIETLKKTR